jgi:hypothetical protein
MKKTVYQIVTGQRVGNHIQHPLIAGYAFHHEGANHYEMRLMMFPGVTYYLSKNRDSLTNYTIFSKCIRDNAGSRFQNPVGSGRLDDNLRSHLEIRFPLLGSKVFMDLFHFREITDEKLSQPVPVDSDLCAPSVA